MKSLSFSEFGNPAAVLAYKDVPLPDMKEGDVRVRMILAPIHHYHLWHIRAKYGMKPNLPAISGDEALGVIEAVGPGAEVFMSGRKLPPVKCGGMGRVFYGKGWRCCARAEKCSG